MAGTIPKMSDVELSVVDMRVMRAIEQGQSIQSLQRIGYNIAQIISSIEQLLELGLMQVVSERVQLTERGTVILREYNAGPDGGSSVWIAPLAEQRREPMPLNAPYVPMPRSLKDILRGVADGRYGLQRNMES